MVVIAVVVAAVVIKMQIKNHHIHFIAEESTPKINRLT